jgi:hypothetical protein
MPKRGNRHAVRRIAGALTCACVLALVGAPSASATMPGIVLPGPATDAATIGKIQSSGAKVVRVFMPWSHMEPTPGQLSWEISNYDDFVNRLNGMGINVYFVVVSTPSWATGGGPDNAPPPAQPLASFMRLIAGHFKGRVIGYEVWNEPDGPVFWQGGATPAAYTAVLRPAYAAAKAADPGAMVGVGGLVGNDYGFVEGLYDAGAAGSFDFVGVHTDNDCVRVDPREAVRDLNGRVSHGSFTGYREIHQTMLAHGDDKPIWMTELGWSVTSARCPSQPSEPAGVTPAQQATYLTHAYACLAADSYVTVATWFSLADVGAADIIPYRFGLFDGAGNARPAFAAFQRVGSVAPDPTCGAEVDTGGPGMVIKTPWDGQNRSGDLLFDATASDPNLSTLSFSVDGHQIRITGKGKLKGRWTGWRKLPLGPHTVVFRSTDRARNVNTETMTVNKVPYGDGEPLRTRIGNGVYGTGGTRLAAGKLYTLPGESRPFARGRLTVHFERKAGPRWRPLGRTAQARVSKRASTAVTLRRHFKPGRYRAVFEYTGYKSFRKAVARRAFTVG